MPDDCFEWQVGFDASDGVNYYALPGSRTTAIADVELGSNVGFTGRYVFKISTPEVLIPSESMLFVIQNLLFYHSQFPIKWDSSMEVCNRMKLGSNPGQDEFLL